MFSRDPFNLQDMDCCMSCLFILLYAQVLGYEYWYFSFPTNYPIESCLCHNLKFTYISNSFSYTVRNLVGTRRTRDFTIGRNLVSPRNNGSSCIGVVCVRNTTISVSPVSAITYRVGTFVKTGTIRWKYGMYHILLLGSVRVYW